MNAPHPNYVLTWLTPERRHANARTGAQPVTDS